ncbi:hypothetical protein [Companilactobacillus ginsenosidimutans]|uniref:Uncharacterized protein n=1 Tax=Companilactobacillus ginsenosidimutans TaxID=1007676 RepID=A0A0H4QLT3_9LACO|nr:hypothetical protein [Companilactobacillus ginsenosidimutans]AKP67663.1 hypothetical protein ABM34_09070 [Companilactobacillus ginsenosidimutans]
MYFHLIILFDYNGIEYAYHKSSDRLDVTEDYKKDLFNRIAGMPNYFGAHMLKTNSPTFKSVQDMDPYFKNMKVINDLDEFYKIYSEYIQNPVLMQNRHSAKFSK